MSAKTILFHSTNTIGFGHMARSVAIAMAVQERHQTIRPFMVVEGSDHGLFRHCGLPALRFPDRHFIDEGGESWLCPSSAREKALSLMCYTILNSFRPNAVLFDLFPSPYFVANVQLLGVPYCVCIREGKPSQMNSYFERNEKLLEGASRLIVPHESERFAVPAKWAGKTEYVGQIVRPFTKFSDHRSTTEILITGGGGGFPGTVEFYNMVIEAFRESRVCHPNLTATLVTGPLFSEWNQLKLTEGVIVIPCRWDLPECAARAALVLCQGGYNTIGEVLQIGGSVICVPGPRGFDDQFARAASAASSYRCFRLFQERDPKLLADLMLKILAESKLHQLVAPPNSEGAQRAADILVSTAAGPG